jgi:very-short-patch-repair endonuclease
MSNKSASPIVTGLEDARKLLLDLSLRNRLINFRPTKRGHMAIVDESSREIFRMLVAEGKAMQFAGVREEEVLPEERDEDEWDDEGSFGPTVRMVQPDVDVLDDKLNTRVREDRLHIRLLHMFTHARTAMEEQGVNILFLSLGMLHWYESENSDEERLAPLILVPAALERYRGTRFRVRFSGEELGTNLSLQAKLKQDFELKLPNLPDDEDVDVESYLRDIARVVSAKSRWRVEPDEMQLGFFSYAKYMMYKDLDPSSWTETLGAKEESVVGQVLGDGFEQFDSDVGPDDLLDLHRPVESVHEVMDADSSQAMVLMDARNGRSMVVEGPPGTGKSQTITNVIAEAVADGKRVLFVAEKMAALEVVKRKMDSVDLGSLCLELHSYKARKREVLEDLRSASELGRPRLDGVELRLNELEDKRARLNNYIIALHSHVGNSGVTPYRAIGELIRLRTARDKLPRSDFSELKELDEASFSRLRSDVAGLQAKISSIGVPSRHPFFECRPEDLLPNDLYDLGDHLRSASDALSVVESSAESLSSALSLPGPETVGDVLAYAEVARHLATSPDGEEQLGLLASEWREGAEWIGEHLKAGRRISALKQQFGSVLREEAWGQPVAEKLDVGKRYGTKSWRFLVPKYTRLGGFIKGMCRTTSPAGKDERLALLSAVDEYQQRARLLGDGQERLATLFGTLWRGEESNWDALEVLAKWAQGLRVLAGRVKGGERLLEVAQGGVDADSLTTLARSAEESVSAFKPRWEPVDATLHPQLIESQADQAVDSLPLDRLRTKLSGWVNDPEGAIEICVYNRLRDHLLRAGLVSLCEVADTWDDGGRWLAEVLEYTWYDGHYRIALKERDALGRFDRPSHERIAEEFRELDRAVLRLNRARVAEVHWQGLPSGASMGALGTLRNEFSKKRRHLPIRQLMEKCWRPIQRIKPVFMMSPLSVAKYIPPDGPTFDIVIFDEASQVRPADAFGALLRGKQALVIGDRQQMPPTSFFQQMVEGGEEGDDSIPVGDMESVLTLFRARGALVRSLLWHYRSRHDSLIAVSNREFYGDRLQVFPSPREAGPDEGLEFVFRPETVYGSGGSSTNPDEALLVAEAILEHARRHPDLTIGAVAFSQKQQESILRRLERLRLEHPELIAFDAMHEHEPLFVKNLENVQGDERDVILISIGYGKNEDGVLRHSFGPVNIDGGERRLNVLISRARQRCVVFANFTADDVDLRRSGARGVQVLKTYLGYAQRKFFDDRGPSGGVPANPFEEAVRDALVREGYDIACQVGSAGYFIDLAVVDPEHPGSYILGIECDGATYHSARSARDRDRLRQEVLESRGWRIHRIWSSDWFARPSKCLQETSEVIKQQLRGADSGPDPEPAAGGGSLNIDRDDSSAVSGDSAADVPEFEPYTETQGLVIPGGKEFHNHSKQTIAEAALQIIRTEGPVHVSEITRALREAAGLKRSGSRVYEAVGRTLSMMCRAEQIQRDGIFYDLPDREQVPVRSRSNLPNARKKLEYVSDAELRQALVTVVSGTFGVEPEQLAWHTLRRMGFHRVTDDMKTRTLKVIDSMMHSGVLKRENGELLVP